MSTETTEQPTEESANPDEKQAQKKPEIHYFDPFLSPKQDKLIDYGGFDTALYPD